VPQGGQLDDTKITWLQSELTAVCQDSAVILTMHHPAVSSDSFHGGSSLDRPVRLLVREFAGVGSSVRGSFPASASPGCSGFVMARLTRPGLTI
jgi:hypothetical protein